MRYLVLRRHLPALQTVEGCDRMHLFVAAAASELIGAATFSGDPAAE
jgi:hypothetical protein